MAGERRHAVRAVRAARRAKAAEDAGAREAGAMPATVVRVRALLERRHRNADAALADGCRLAAILGELARAYAVAVGGARDGRE